MSLLEKIGLQLFHQFEPERAHRLSLKALNMGLAPTPGPVTSPRLQCNLAGMPLPNPVGLAAGYDKNAECLAPLSRAGFGFLEVGAATPLPQYGNPKPRLFRLSPDRAVINRFGFNNEGIAEIAARLSVTKTDIPRGLNLGANKESADRAKDYCRVLQHAAPHIDFATLNISSPNTENLRDLQGKDALEELLGQVCDTNDDLEAPLPLFLKIAPDLSEAEISDIAALALSYDLDGIITTNTTLDRPDMIDLDSEQAGGLSGVPLFEKSTRVLAQMHLATSGRIPLIGVGGISNARDAFSKICAGATAVQLYSAMVFHGLSLIPKIARELDVLLEENGFGSVDDAVGIHVDDWA